MGTYKKYFVIVLLTIFMVSSIGASAMANCDVAMARQGSMSMHMEKVSMEKAASDSAHGLLETAAEHHGSCDENTSSPECSDCGEKNSSANCFDCDGGLCQTQSLVSVRATLGLYNLSDVIYIAKDVSPDSIFLTIIPEPPRQLS